MKFTVALAQIDNTLGDLEKNIAKHVEQIRRARDGGADLVIFPELSLTGYTLRDINWDIALRTNDRRLDPILDETDDIGVVLGCVEESRQYGIYNSAFYLEKNEVRAVHRKVYPPTYGMFEESRYFSHGRNVEAFDTSLGRMGILVCEDLWHLPLPYILAQDGAEMIIGVAASPTRLAGEDARLKNAQVNSEQHRTIARLLSTYVVFCNRVGYEDGVNFWGGSEVIGPAGDVLVQAKLFDDDMVFADIDGNELRRARRLSRHFLDDDPDLVRHELRRVATRKRPVRE